MFTAITINKKTILLVTALIMLMLALSVAYCARSYPAATVPVTEEAQKLVPIYYVDTPEKKVALSFDACWGAEKTPLLLDILDDYDIKTTFFVTGIWVDEYPEVAAKIVSRGHEIGNHSASHPHMSKLTPAQIEDELREVEKKIYKICRKRTVLFRPPFGEYNNTLIETAGNLGYKTIQWSIDSLDWQNHSKEAIIERVTGKAHNGAIVLFHNDGLHTPAALPEVIEFYQENDYEIVPISQLIYRSGYEIDPQTGAQRRRQVRAEN